PLRRLLAGAELTVGIEKGGVEDRLGVNGEAVALGELRQLRPGDVRVRRFVVEVEADRGSHGVIRHSATGDPSERARCVMRPTNSPFASAYAWRDANVAASCSAASRRFRSAYSRATASCSRR